MLTLGIRYLCGRATASDPSDRDQVEWPPHPGRVYMALASAYFEGSRPDEERRALEALESLPPPEILMPDAGYRTVTTQYVPVNDSADPRQGAPMGSMPLGRNRQPRTFPSVPLELDAELRIVWAGAELTEEIRDSLARLCSRVARVGHSSSLVQMYLIGDEKEATEGLERWTPVEEGAQQELRVTGAGRLADLEASYSHELRPSSGLWTGYRSGSSGRDEPAESVFEPNMVILRISKGPKVDLASTSKLALALRGAVMGQAPDPVPEVIGGHLPDGGPSQRPHLAFVPLAHVGHEHADGSMLGLAVVLPRGLSAAERRMCLAAVAGTHRRPTGELYVPLYLGYEAGRAMEWELEPEFREQPPLTLVDRTWTRPSTIWASVTPVALDRYVEDEEDQREVVVRSCRRIGVPEPVEVRLSSVSWWLGALSAPEMPPLTKGSGGPKRFHLHAWLRFDRPVRGPVLLGAGRYRGYGLCKPMVTREWGVGKTP